MCAATRAARICPKCHSQHVEAIQAAVVQTLICRGCGHMWSADQSGTIERCPDCDGVGIPTEAKKGAANVQLRCPYCNKQWNRAAP